MGVLFDWKIFAVCVFVVGASYLIASIPAVNAASVTITSGSSSATTTYTPENDLSKDISIADSSGSVRVRVSNNSVSSSIESVYVYKCRDRNPSSCFSEVTPESFAGNTDVTYTWAEVSDTATNQNANIMLLVRVMPPSPKQPRWLVFWSSGSSGPPYSMLDYNISSISIAAKSVGYVTPIKNFIDLNGMIPFNPTWISSIAFSGMSGLYKADSMTPPPASGMPYSSGNSISSLAGSLYEFILPSDGLSVYNGAVVANSSSYVCGDGICSTSLGEGSANCCQDCGTTSAYYCDTALGQKLLANIQSSVASSSPIKIMNCNQQNTISVGFVIGSMPTGTSVVSAQYTLNGSLTPQGTSCASAGGNVFNCNVLIPAVSGCTGTDYLLNPNAMTLTIRFNHASSTMTRTLNVANFSQITVGSWTCGSLGCEASLGETAANCCYDCGCAAGQYCDYNTQPSTAACKNPLTGTDLQIYEASPISFYTHNNISGDTVMAGVKIMNKPSSLQVSGAGCRVTSCLEDGLPCTAACTITCDQQASLNPDIYNSTCRLNYRVTSGYNATKGYSVYSSINRTLSYNNGTWPAIAATLDAVMPAVGFGAHWRGDGVCNPDESNATVCFDCACDGLHYCNTSSRLGASVTDSCRPISDANVTLDGATSGTFSDSWLQHNITVTAHSGGLPAGFSVSGRCSFNGSVGGPMCVATCWSSPTASRNDITCNVTLPPINYRVSPFYNNVTRTIIIPNNMITITSRFNNGSLLGVAESIFAIPDVTVNVVSSCGDRGCESDIGENSANCCVDCGCGSGTFCLNSTSVPNGVCKKTSDILLVFDGTVPSSIECTIQDVSYDAPDDEDDSFFSSMFGGSDEEGTFTYGDCIFLSATYLKTHIINMPNTTTIQTAWFTYDNGNSTDVYCRKNTTIGADAYTCSIIFENVATPNPGGSTTTAGTLSMTISYRENGTTRTQNISAPITISVYNDKSDYVEDCEEQIEEYNTEIEELEETETIIIAVMAAILGIAAGCTIACLASGGVPKPWGVKWTCMCGYWGLCIGSCVAAVLIPTLIDTMDEIDSLKAEREAICNSDDYDSLSDSVDSSFDIGSTMISLVLGIVCVICLMKAFGMTKNTANTNNIWTSEQLQNSMNDFGGVGYSTTAPINP